MFATMWKLHLATILWNTSNSNKLDHFSVECQHFLFNKVRSFPISSKFTNWHFRDSGTASSVTVTSAFLKITNFSVFLKFYFALIQSSNFFHLFWLLQMIIEYKFFFVYPECSKKCKCSDLKCKISFLISWLIPKKLGFYNQDLKFKNCNEIIILKKIIKCEYFLR